MAKNIDTIAKKLGATVIGPVPETGGGAFGAAKVAQVVVALKARLVPGQGKRPGRPTDPIWVYVPKVPMSEVTMAKLTRLAAQIGEAGRRVSPMQLAAQLLEEAVARLPDEAL
ncbi:MAG: hypothetical protein JWO38_2828 [Gemmataceae bacterium]|nr:hypothetical protein [Gemmataceae bacterium]